METENSSSRVGSGVTVRLNGATGTGANSATVTAPYICAMGDPTPTNNYGLANWGIWSEYCLFNGNSADFSAQLRANVQPFYGTPSATPRR